MDKKNFSKMLIIFTMAALLFGYTGCAPAGSTPAQVRSIQPSAPTKAPLSTAVPQASTAAIQISYTAVQMNGSSAMLQDAMANVLKSPDLAQSKISVTLSSFSQAMGCPDTLGILPPAEVNLFMMASHTELYAFRDGAKFLAVPDNILAAKTIRPFQFQTDAFRDPSSKAPIGLPVATMPLMLIFNPDKLPKMPDPVTLDDVISLAGKNPLWLPVHMGLGGATFQALGGDNFSEETSLNTEVIRSFIREAPRFNQLQKSLRSASDAELVAGFIEGTLTWTIHDSSFLLLLAAKGYTGSLDVRPFPIIKIAGSSAMSWAWAVPEKSANADVAWKLVELLAADKGQTRWLLSQGLLPATTGGFDQLRSDSAIADGFLPAGLLKAPDIFDRLQKIVESSRPWRIPPQISTENYQKIVVPTVLDLIRGFIDGKSPFEETINHYLDFLPKIR